MTSHGAHASESTTFPFWRILLAFLLLCGCQSVSPEVDSKDLVEQSRQWRRERGMAAARDELKVALAKLDEGGGYIEQRLLRANADKEFKFPDSLASFSKAQRKRTGIFFLLGFHTENDISEKIVEHVEESLCSQGWAAKLVRVPPHRTVCEEAVIVEATLEKELRQVDRAIVVGFSKGGLSWMQWLAQEAHQLPKAERKKIRLMLTFAGVLRGSAVASWVARGGVPFAATTRGFIRAFDSQADEVLKDVQSICDDPWRGGGMQTLRTQAPGMKLVSLVAIPEGRDGFTHVHRGFQLLSRLVALQWRWLGPLDGMTESASQVLPHDAGIPQHIVRVLGSHAVLDGHYLNGAAVSQAFLRKDENAWQGGEELLDDLLRALPRAWVMAPR